MNDEIKHLYEGLDAIYKQNIRDFFAKSPKMLLFIDLLEQGQNITTTKAVHYIYQDEITDTAQSILINRFYKLRQKIRLWLLSQLKNSPICLTSEEQELAFLRLMVIKNEHIYALDGLKVLEKKCWDNNLFELLPELIQLILRASHAAEALNKEVRLEYLEKLEKANELLNVLNKLQYYLHYLQNNTEEYTPVMESIRRKIKPLKSYPRFAMLYHLIAFSVGVFLEDVVLRTSNAMSRHLNQFNKLKKKHPQIPICDVEPHDRIRMEIHFCMKVAMFWFHKKEPKKSFKAIQEREMLIAAHPDLQPKASETELHNLIYFCINATQYQAALQYIGQLESYQSVNPSDQLDTPYYVYEMLAYTALFPKIQIDHPRQLVQQIQQFLKTAPESSNWLYESLAEYCILYEYFQNARNLLQAPQTKALFKKYGITNQTSTLLEVVEYRDLDGLKQLIEFLQLKLQDASSKFTFHYKGLLKIAKYFDKKFKNKDTKTTKTTLRN